MGRHLIEYKFSPILEPTKTHYIAFRIFSKSMKDLDKFLRFLHKFEKAFMVSENDTSNHHYQGFLKVITNKKLKTKSFIDNSNKTRTGLRDQFRPYIEGTGNESYSLKQGDGNGRYIQYLCKELGGDKKPILNTMGLTQVEILEHHKNYYREQELLKKAKNNKEYHAIKEVELDWKYLNQQDQIQWCMKTIKYYLDNGKTVPDNFMLRRKVRTFMLMDAEDPQQLMLNIARDIYVT